MAKRRGILTPVISASCSGRTISRAPARCSGEPHGLYVHGEPGHRAVVRVPGLVAHRYSVASMPLRTGPQGESGAF
jgi:hypothetical protein